MNTMLNINPWSVLSELLDANSRAARREQPGIQEHARTCVRTFPARQRVP